MIGGIFIFAILGVIALAVFAALTIRSDKQSPGGTETNTGLSADEGIPSTMLKALYAVFIGIMITLFVITGIMAFYPVPKSPENCYT